nr:hypothetical protein [Methylobacterium sp. Leaf122]
MLIHPREFRTEYVAPAVELYRQHRLEKHLAVHAISQMDNLAEMVALHVLLAGRQKLNIGEASRFRRRLRRDEPVLGIIHDVHDSHKHGRLVRADNTHNDHNPGGASKGQRPETVGRASNFLGASHFGEPPIRYEVLVMRLDDGTEKEVFQLLSDATQAWEREFTRRGL